MNTLYDVTAVIEHPLDIFRVDGAGEVRIAVVFTFAGGCTYALKQKSSNNNKTHKNTDIMVKLVVLTQYSNHKKVSKNRDKHKL